MDSHGTVTSLSDENRVFEPHPEFTAQANVSSADIWAQADADPVAFWEQQAQRIEWHEPWHTAHTWHPAAGGTVPSAEWFAGGTLNVAVNCVDRHVQGGLGDRTAIQFEGERGDRETITYAELQRRVARAANALTALGIGKGDRVVIYLPVIPETVVVTLAVARIGAIHSLVFGGFSAEALRFRVEDTGAKLLVTSDGQFRRGAAVPVKQNADAAVAGVATVEHVLVVQRTGELTPDIAWTEGRDVWWHDALAEQPDEHEPEFFDAETPLFIIYTSGTTGTPKGLVHTSGGYLVQASWTHWALFDAKADDVYWCTADLAWVTAHTYVLYGPFSNAATSVLYEGTPDTPHRARHFDIIERYGVTTYYTAPTLIRTLMSWFPDGVPAEWDLSTIRLLGTVGESINPEAWMWFRTHIGRGVAPVVDTWWQSETGAAIVAPLPGLSALKPGSATRALPGLAVRVVDERGDDVPAGSGGLLVIDGTWPAMARTVWNNPQRYLDTYWRTFADRGYFLAGDSARRDSDGYVWLLGRSDDVINVSGHRLSTIEIESALVAHPDIAEAGVVGVSDARTGQSIAAFVIVNDGANTGTDVTARLQAHVASAIGPIAKPQFVLVVPDLPKTRSGKIMRRLLVDIAEGRPLGDTTSLQNPDGPAAIAALLRETPPVT